MIPITLQGGPSKGRQATALHEHISTGGPPPKSLTQGAWVGGRICHLNKVSGDAEATGTTLVNHRSLVPFSDRTQAEESPWAGAQQRQLSQQSDHGMGFPRMVYFCG